MANVLEIFEWAEYAGSSRGLLARPTLPNNVIALREHIEAIEYSVSNLTTGDPVETGDLDPAVVMLTAPSGKNTWNKDTIGYTFLWPMPGTLIPDPLQVYQIVVTFTTTVALGSKQFVRVWKSNTYDPAIT